MTGVYCLWKRTPPHNTFSARRTVGRRRPAPLPQLAPDLSNNELINILGTIHGNNFRNIT